MPAIDRALGLAFWKTQRADPALNSSSFSNVLSQASVEEEHFAHTASLALRTLIVLSQVSSLPSLV